MTQQFKQQRFTGERALFQCKDAEITLCTFADGESPLKESSHLQISNSMFQWKYPLWYCHHVAVEDSTWFEMARAGIWYTTDLQMKNVTMEAPKNFRRCERMVLEDVHMPNAAETLWNCRDVRMKNCTAKGEYFGMNGENVEIDGFTLVGNYPFDGGRNLIIRNARLLSKDAFWNCDGVTVYNSFISGEYLGWNSKNLTFVNCTIESLQGLCYAENVVLKNCRLLNTTLAFEYSTVDADVEGKIDSVCNPAAGVIRADEIGELTMDPTKVSVEKTRILIRKDK